MRRKSMKKVVTVLMGMAMILFAATIPTNACEKENETAAVENVVAPRAVACPHCGSSAGRHTSTAWADWYRTGGQRNCEHDYLWGVDLKRQRDGVKTVVCSQCGVKISSENVSETEWECHGFN